MSVYLDANVLFALFFRDDALHAQAYSVLNVSDLDAVVSDFARAEFASVVAREVRNASVGRVEARDLFSLFDSWAETKTGRVQLRSEDVTVAESLLRRLDLNLRAPDALHLAMVQRLGARLATFDNALSGCARILKISVLSG